MSRLTLFRQSDNRIQTLGEFEAGSEVIYSLELPWKDNQRRVSCIPAGVYQMVKHVSPKFGNCYWIKDVPNRSEILIHPANHVGQLLGCIAPGLGRSDFDGDGQIDVTNSRAAMEKLLDMNFTELEVFGVGG
jgi:hypothetical protein